MCSQARHTRRFPKSLQLPISVLIMSVAAAFLLPATAAPSRAAKVSPAREQEKQKYLGKDYIDSTVLRAIYLINDASSVAGVGFRTKESLEEAWRIANKIKKEAKGDPNERYALWKVNELEWLIRLEERDLLLQKMKESEATVNQIIADYNSEVGKSRPDFKNLLRMHSRMLEFNTDQANHMASSINNRVRAISREAVMGLEKALISRNSTLADQEFKYLLRNRPYLKISDKTFADLEARASACVRAQDELPTIKEETALARDLVSQVRLGDARNMLGLAQYRFSDIRDFIPEQEASKLYRGISEVERQLAAVEDSLVRLNLDILSRKGVNAANNFLQSVVREKGVCRDKIARIDQAILSIGSPSTNTRMEREIDDVAMAAENVPENDIMGEMRAKAAQKAKVKLDSIQREEEKRAALEKKRQDSIEAVARKAASEEYRANRDLSVKIASKIYDLIEKNKARVAYDMFLTKQQMLERYLAPEAYAMLETTVSQASDPNWNGGAGEIFYLKPVADNTKQATTAGRKSEPSSSDANRDRAMTIITEIYAMLDRNEKAEAQGRFSREQLFLQTYLDKDAFDMLKTTVAQIGR